MIYKTRFQLIVYLSFLIKCAAWIGEGRHIDLLVAILECGFDPGDIDSPLFAKWPSPCSPNWRSEEIAPDPFFIEYLAILVMSCPGWSYILVVSVEFY